MVKEQKVSSVRQYVNVAIKGCKNLKKGSVEQRLVNKCCLMFVVFHFDLFPIFLHLLVFKINDATGPSP